jgi:hypothetical protein|tara:strand:- start:873 stop:2165 length:1293 start_codon:yes stop_codon:yes gene_type:complete
MAKPRYRTQKVERKFSNRPLAPRNDVNAGKDATVTSPENGAVTIQTVQSDYYPWDAGAHIVAENVEDFSINKSLDFLETAADKTHRDPNNRIISQVNSDAIGQDFVIVPQRYVLERDNYVSVVDTSISELLPTVVYGPKSAPVLRENPNSGETTGIIVFPSIGTIDGKISDGWSIYEDKALSLTALQFPANHSRILVADAYSYLGDNDLEVEDGLSYEWIFNSDNPAKNGLETRKKISNRVVSKTKKLALINATKFDTGYYHCRIKNNKGQTETPQVYIYCFGGIIIERDEIRGGENNEFLGYGAPTGELIDDQQHNDQYKLTDGWFDFNIETNEWARTGWDPAGEEWYIRDNYRGFNPWRVPKYGPEPKQNEVPDERVVNPTKTSVVSRTPETSTLPQKRVQTVQPQQKTVQSVKPDGSKGRNTRIQGR